MDDAAQIPPTRWELADEAERGYGARFRELIEQGADIVGEARLADVLAPREARILDAGCGIGRIGAELRRRGHRVLGVEKDASLVAASRELHPDLPVFRSDILALTADTLRDQPAPPPYDVVVLVGNVLVLAAEGTEVWMLRTLGELLAPDGRILVGFHLEGGPVHKRCYTVEEFTADVAAAGLRVEQHFGGYDLRPPTAEYVVALLGRADRN